MKYLYIILIILIIIFLSKNNEQFYNENSFNHLLQLRRKLERVEGIKKHIKLTKSNIISLKNKYKNYFYTLVDSGNIGSKINSDFYVEYMDIPIIKKYYFGKLNKIDISNNIDNFIIKPYNLCNSQGLLLIKNKKDILKNKNFNNNKEIINYYKNKYLKDTNQLIIVQEYIKSKIRPPEIKIYSFNGTTALIMYIKWITPLKRTKHFFNNKWELVYGKYIKKPQNLNKIINDADKLTSSLKTFMRIDFLIDEYTGKYYFCENSSFPLCGKTEYYPSPKIDIFLYDYWKNSFPFNKLSMKQIYNKTKNYKKKELCEN